MKIKLSREDIELLKALCESSVEYMLNDTPRHQVMQSLNSQLTNLLGNVLTINPETKLFFLEPGK